jgi:uncharacterized protein (TIGR03083 family)
MSEPVPDYAGAYREVRLGLAALLRARPDDDLDAIAPATPEWRVRDIAAHLAGVCGDIVQGNMSGVASDEWTAAQVAARTDWTMARLLEQWTADATVVEQQMNEWGPGMGQMVFDAFTHEQDIRGALGEPGGRESAAAAIGFDWFVTNIRRRPGAESGEGARPAIRLVTEADDVEILGPGPVAATLRVSRYEFVRAITGRRSRHQIEAFGWEGEPRVDDLFFTDLFRPAPADLLE